MPVSKFQLATLEAYPSDIESDRDLAANRLAVVKKDFEWRERYTDMKRYKRLYEDSGTMEGDIPRVNKIKQAVNDHVSVALQNIPSVRMKSLSSVYMSQNPIEQAILAEAKRDSEETINAKMREIMSENHFDDEAEKVLKQSGMYGVGYFLVDVDDRMDARQDPMIQRLMRKPMVQWTDREWQLLQALSKKTKIRWIDSRYVAGEYGRRRFEDYRRISYVEHASTSSLRVKYQNPDIMPGTYPFFLDTDHAENHYTTAVVHTWELEPVHVTKSMTMQGESYSVDFTAWRMVKTIVAGNELLHKEVSDPFTSRVRLPIIPVYLEEAEDHAYGLALPEQLENSERFINLMRMISYKAAKKSAAGSAVFVKTSMLTSGDKQRVERGLDVGGGIGIEGNVKNTKISDIVQPVQLGGSLSNAPLEAMAMEEGAFQEMSGSVDMQAMTRAESGTAKRTQMMAADRRKGMSLGTVTRAWLYVYETVFELLQKQYSEYTVEGESTAEESQGDIAFPERPGTVRTAQGERMEVTFNQRVEDKIPRVDTEGQVFASPKRMSPSNPLGIVEDRVTYVLNDLSLPMYAEAKWRGELPANPTERFNQLLMYRQTGLIVEDTMRDAGLPDGLKQADDANRIRLQQRQRVQQQRQMQQLQAMAGQETNPNAVPGEVPRSPESDAQVPTNPMGGAGIPGELGGAQAGAGIQALQSMQGADGPLSSEGVSPQEMMS